uniref:GOLD domain-containing protein n=1 Tax=Anisakis simplex TaxID=6269 RepID=A0A0M3JS24_ANISI
LNEFKGRLRVSDDHYDNPVVTDPAAMDLCISRIVRNFILLYLINIIIIMDICHADEFSFTVIIPPGKTECYSHPIDKPKYAFFELDYQVIGGGDSDITFYVLSPKGSRILIDVRSNDAMHRVELKEPQNGYGDYTFCFDNTFSIQSEKRVFFEFFLMDESGQFLGGFDEKFSVADEVLRTLDTRLEHFQNVTVSVKDNLNKVERIQRQYASLELSDRKALETSFEMINFWSMVHLSVMVVALLVQVYMVRCLFEDESKMGRFLRKGRLND